MSFVNIEKPAAGAEGPRMDAEWLDAHWMPYTGNRQFKANPRMIVEGSGAYYTDSEGRKILTASRACGARAWAMAARKWPRPLARRPPRWTIRPPSSSATRPRSRWRTSSRS